MAETKVHIVPHTHWDREWYFTSSRSTVYLVKHLSEVLDVLEKNDEYQYYLMDAQTSLIEDYLRYRPEDQERIEKLVSEKRLYIGPWYTQTDQLVISQESVVRNLLYGTKYAENLGHSMKIGYVPDAFGQGGNMPQIYHHFGINRFLFWRGVADNRLKQTEFVWEGDDGTRMIAVQMPFGYYYGGNIPEDVGKIPSYLNEYIGRLEEKASTKHVYFPNGFDQAPIRTNLPNLVKTFNQLDAKREYVIASPESFFEELEQDVRQLPVLKGELTEGKHSRLHKSIFSTRADLKQLNNEIENYISNVLEPILTISYSLGNPYPHKEIEEIWKLMFQNAAHDSIGGCNSDTTNKDVAFRLKLAKDKAENLADLHKRLMAERIPYQHDLNFTLFNPLPYKRSGVVRILLYIPENNFTIKNENGDVIPYTILNKTELTDYVLKQTIQLDPSKNIYKPEKVYLADILLYVTNVNGLGYDSYYLELEDQIKEETSSLSKHNAIENEFYRIQIAENHTLTITEKKTGKVYENQMVFVENGDDGDSYNYSPPRKDMIISSCDGKIEDVQYDTSNLQETLTMKINMQVPYDLEMRAAGIADQNFSVIAKVSLRKQEEIIRFEVTAHNHVLSHRLCVQFHTDIASKFSVADQLFGTVERPVYLPTMEVWEEENWEEAPISIEPMQSYVALHNEKSVVSVMTEGVREYEIVGEKFDTIQLTLFRTFGFMGKENLLYRPGRASGEPIVETPDAQLLGNITATFALVIKNGSNFDGASIGKIAKEYLTPIQYYQSSDFLNGRMIFAFREEEKTLPLSYSLFDFGKMTSVVSALKKAEDADQYIIRLFNPFLSETSTISNLLLEQGKFVKLDERTADDAKRNLQPREFKTIVIPKDQLRNG